VSDVVLVLGMHRSGTSAVSGALTKLGCGAPKTLMPAFADNPRGYFESVAVADFHDELLDSAGSHWSDWRVFNPAWRSSSVAASFRARAKELFAGEFGNFPLPLLKDPRVCRFAPFWLDVFKELKLTPHIVMPIRSPLDVAKSLKRRDGFSMVRGMALWLRHVLDSEAHTRGEARSIFPWKALLSDWRKTCDKIATDTRLTWPRQSDRAAYDIERFLSEKFVHHNGDQIALAAHSDTHEWTLRAYEALLELARNPQSNSAMATLDEIRAAFDRSSEMFGRLLVGSELEAEEARERAEQLGQEDYSPAEPSPANEAAAAIEMLRARLVDAEAAVAGLKAERPRRGFRAWFGWRDSKSQRLAKRLLRSGLFDAEFYRANYLSSAGQDGRPSDFAAARHFLAEGFCNGLRPNPLFDTRWYLERYDDVRRSGINPLLHYLSDGFREGRDPGPEFDTRFYLESNPDVREAGFNPLAHYLRHGQEEGRPALPARA
jgi:hypothetical protein